MEIDLSAAVAAMTEAVWSGNGRYLERTRKTSEHALTTALPHILAALIAEADADHDAAEDMSGYWAEASFHAAEWLRAKLPL